MAQELRSKLWVTIARTVGTADDEMAPLLFRENTKGHGPDIVRRYRTVQRHPIKASGLRSGAEIGHRTIPRKIRGG